MQTSTLSRNKYTRRQREGVGRSNSVLINRIYRNILQYDDILLYVCHQQYGHTDIIGQGHFFKHFNQKSEMLLIDGNLSPGVHIYIFPPSSQRRGSVLKFACR